MLLERDARLSCYETGNDEAGEFPVVERSNENGTNHFPLLQFGDVLLKYQPPLGLNLRLLPDGMLGKELIGSRECRVVINIWVPFE